MFRNVVKYLNASFLGQGPIDSVPNFGKYFKDTKTSGLEPIRCLTANGHNMAQKRTKLKYPFPI